MVFQDFQLFSSCGHRLKEMRNSLSFKCVSLPVRFIVMIAPHYCIRRQPAENIRHPVLQVFAPQGLKF